MNESDVTLLLADSHHERRLTRRRLTAGWLRIGARLVDSGPHSLHSNLRVLLVADVLRRVVEDLHAGQVQLAVILPAAASGEPDEPLPMALPFGLETFGIRPPTGVGGGPDAAAELIRGRCDVIVEPSTDTLVSTPRASQFDVPLSLHVGGVTAPVPARGREPLVTRLALLRPRRGEPVSLEPAPLDQAEQTLSEWRSCVAEWAQHPSAPMHQATVESARAALDDNLDVRTALGLLHQLMENPAVPPGAKFETFVFLDRVFALDLTQELGQPLRDG